MKIKKEPPPTKRHEVCFTSNSDLGTTKVKYIQDKISCKLLTKTKKKPKPTDNKADSLLVKSKKTKSDKCCSSQERNKCVKCLFSSSTKSVKKQGTFGTEKRKSNLTIIKDAPSTKSSSKKINEKLPFKDVKSNVNLTLDKTKIFKSRSPSPIIKSSVKRTSSLSPTKNLLNGSSLESLKSPTLIQNTKTKTNSKKLDLKKNTETKIIKPSKQKISKEKAKDICNNIINKTLDLPKTISSEDIQKARKVVESDNFFQHLFLGYYAPNTMIKSKNSLITDQMFFKTKSALSEPNVKAMKIYLNNTKPVTFSKFKDMEIRSRSASPLWRNKSNEEYYEHSNKIGRSISLPPKLYFSQTSRPVSPIIKRKDLSRCESPLSVPRSPSLRRIEHFKYSPKNFSEPLHKEKFFYNSTSSLASQSTISLRSLDHTNPSDYLRALHYCTRRSPKFKDLNQFYATIERLGELERIASANYKPRKRSENEIIDFDRWKEVHVKERTEKEINVLCEKLKAKEKDEGFLFRPKDVKRWKRELDRGLRIKEKSVDNIRQELENLKLFKDHFDEKNLNLSRDTYKPLWRGSSVLNLANTMVEKRSHSEGRVPVERKISWNTEKLLTQNIGRRIWSSLSMEQVNTLKNQLTEIYNGDKKSKKPELSIFVPPKQRSTENLSAPKAPEQKKLNKSVVVEEQDKKRILKSLGKEVMTLFKSKKEDAVQAKNKPLKINRNDSLSPITKEKIKPSSESGSTDGSTKTVIHVAPKEGIKDKVDYFEKAHEIEEYVPTVYKPADLPMEDEAIQDHTRSNLDKSKSQSQQDMKELLGEKEIMKFATLPLSTNRRFDNITRNLDLRTTNMSPCRFSVSEATSNESLFRSRSLSPFMVDDIPCIKSGKVRKLRHKFEHHRGYYHEIDDLAPRRCFSDTNLYDSLYLPALTHVDVDSLRRKYEYPVHAGRGRSRIRRGGVVSPLFLRAEDRFMPHINIISKIANLCAQKYKKNEATPKEDFHNLLANKEGDVEKLKEKFDAKDVSLLGKMFTSTPDMKELRDIAPYLTGPWTAHRHPKSSENTILLKSPNDSVASMDTTLVRRVSSISPQRQTKKTILKSHRRSQSEDSSKIRKADTRDIRYSSHWTQTKPSVTFKEPEPPLPPPKGHHHSVTDITAESPRKYVENQVTIHYKTPVRQEIKEYYSEDELAQKQTETLRKIYQEERRRKYLQELQDMQSRRHTDNFIPSQKSPISLNRYDDFDHEFDVSSKPRPRSPEPKLVARGLYNFVGVSPRELTFRKGDLIYVRRQIDKNWYEGELNAMVGLFPVNYVEIVPYDKVKTTPRKSYEGQARAKFNFQAKTHLELSLTKGETVVITRRVDDNWYEGKIGGRRGIFPVSYVDVLIDPQEPSKTSSKPVAAPAAHSMLPNGIDSMGSHSYTPNVQFQKSYYAKPVQINGIDHRQYGSMDRGQKPPLRQSLHVDTPSEPTPYKALYKYLPQNDDELELMEGDKVYVLEKCDDGWFVGSNERTGAFGTFPGNYVDKA